MRFSQIIKLQYGRKTPNIALYFTASWIIIAELSLKNGWLPPNFLFRFQQPLLNAKICFSHIVINRAKILLY